MTAADTHSARFPRGPLKLARERLQQTCEAGARQHTIASGSCCCKTLAGSRSCPEFRRESFGVTARVKSDCHGLERVRSARERVS
jgi:hypothetical protein